MKRTFRTVLAGLLAIPVLALGMSVALPSGQYASAADDLTITSGADAAKTDDQQTELFGSDGLFTKIINAALYLIGAVSVLMLIYGGIRYTLSAGNATSVTAAKNTILYAIVGIVVALLAFAIVNWVLTSLLGN